MKIENAKTALQQGAAFSLRSDSNGELPKLLALLCLPDKPGEHLIRDGFSTRAHMEFIADYVLRKHAKGEELTSIARNLAKIAAGNSSQFRQALPKLVVKIDDKEFSYGALYPAGESADNEADSAAADC